MIWSEESKMKLARIMGAADSIQGLLCEGDNPVNESDCWYEIYWMRTSPDILFSNYQIMGRLIKHFEEARKAIKGAVSSKYKR